MGLQHQIILSLGSNQENKLDSILSCINLIHNEVGSVVAVSKLYQSASWGFDSDDFYNCNLLVHTHKTAHQVLTLILDIEKRLGRERNHDVKGYSSRTIDIDLIAYNDEVIQDDELVLPHPQMQNRKFVLLPLRDIMPDFFHPLLKLTLKELIDQCTDQGECFVVNSLPQPFEKYNIKVFNRIIIEGNIGAGKTTLATKISEDFNAKLVLEGFADNPFLPKFYEDQARYAFPLEMSFLADRYQQLSEDLAQFDLFKDFIVADYYIFKSLIFAKVTLGDDEYRLYRKIFDIMYKEISKPDLYVYLYQNTDRLLANIKKRGREYEQDIPSDYLDKINQGYLEYIKQHSDFKVLVIDVSDKDFVENQEDYLFVLDQIQKSIV